MSSVFHAVEVIHLLRKPHKRKEREEKDFIPNGEQDVW